MAKIIKSLNDCHDMKDQITKIISSGDRCPNRTSITIVDHNTGEILQELHNKILAPGGQVAAMKLWGHDRLVPFPPYDQELGLDGKPEFAYADEETDNANPIICLWCAGRDGFLSSPNEQIVVSNTDRIPPTTVVINSTGNKIPAIVKNGEVVESSIDPYTGIMPFRYVPITNDLDFDNRELYFGRKVIDGYAAYYFKAFDTTPQMFISYLDSTDVKEDMWDEGKSNQQVEVYMETRLNINRLDFRDYFDKVLGWNNANVSSISLLIAYKVPTDIVNNNDDHIFLYKDVIPYSKLNFKAEDLTELDRALDFIYRVYY